MDASTATKESSLENSNVIRTKRKSNDDDNSPCSSIMGAEVDKTISDVELLRILECPVCNEFPAPPIFSCEKGHFTCNSCIKLLDSCSLCTSPFTQVRNFALESIIENSKFKCRNLHLGCDLIVSGGELNQHVADCLYRPLECKVPDCLRVNLTPAEYFTHIVENHSVSGCYKELIDGKTDVILTQNEGCENISPYYIKIRSPENKDVCTILVFSKRYRTFMCWWVASLEPQKITQFEISLSLDNQLEEESLSVRWKLPLQPIWNDFDTVRDTGRCAVLPDTSLIPFLDNNSWDLKVEISKKGHRYTNFQHYYPLLMLVVVGIIAVIASYIVESGLNWFHSMNSFANQDFNDSCSTTSTTEDPSKQGDFSDEYIGYRGFYYKTN